MEENLNIEPTNKSSKKGVLILITVLILIIAGLLVFIFVIKDDDKDKNTNNNNNGTEVTNPTNEGENINNGNNGSEAINPTNEKENNNNVNNGSEVINPTNEEENNNNGSYQATEISEDTADIYDFIKAATYTTQGDAFVFDKISKGDYNLSKNDKLQLVSLSLVNIKEKYSYVTTVPKHLKSNVIFNYFDAENKDVLVIDKSLFDSEYKKLFKEDIGEYSFNGDYVSCPNPELLDTKENKIYVLARCGGTGYPVFTETSYSTKNDGSYIYVNQSGTYGDKTFNFEWKFNTDGKFISVTLK